MKNFVKLTQSNEEQPKNLAKLRERDRGIFHVVSIGSVWAAPGHPQLTAGAGLVKLSKSRLGEAYLKRMDKVDAPLNSEVSLGNLVLNERLWINGNEKNIKTVKHVEEMSLLFDAFKQVYPEETDNHWALSLKGVTFIKKVPVNQKNCECNENDLSWRS